MSVRMVYLKRAQRAAICKKFCVHCWFALFDARILDRVANKINTLKKYTV